MKKLESNNENLERKTIELEIKNKQLEAVARKTREHERFLPNVRMIYNITIGALLNGYWTSGHQPQFNIMPIVGGWKTQINCMSVELHVTFQDVGLLKYSKSVFSNNLQ